jgi:hypothetical protein
MEQKPRKQFLFSQQFNKFLAFKWHPKIHCRANKSSPLVPSLSQMGSIAIICILITHVTRTGAVVKALCYRPDEVNELFQFTQSFRQH